MSLVSNSLHQVPARKIWSHGKGPNVKKLQQFNALNVRGLHLDSEGRSGQAGSVESTPIDRMSPRSGKGGPVLPSTIDTVTLGASSDVLDQLEAWNLSMGGH